MTNQQRKLEGVDEMNSFAQPYKIPLGGPVCLYVCAYAYINSMYKLYTLCTSYTFLKMKRKIMKKKTLDP